MFTLFFPKNKASRTQVEEEHALEETQSSLTSTSASANLLDQLSRTSLLVLDYKQFVAARRIQSLWRGHRERQLLDERWRAAITIQRWWRGFVVRHNFASRIEAQLQQTLLDHYNRAATKIQAFFRGWYTRQTVHDMNSLRRLHLSAAEELLSCVAYKLHHLLRTYSIPGVYSLRNSHCLSAVEKLLSSMNYRFHNDRVRFYRARTAQLAEARREQFRQNTFMTEVPYAGPNFNTLCKPQCDDPLFISKDMDRRMYKIIAEYEQSQIDSKLMSMHHNVKQRKIQKHVDNMLSRIAKNQRDFCGDVIASMRKWKILDDQVLTIRKDIFRNPENLQRFLADASKIMESLETGTCYCQIPVYDKLYCTAGVRVNE